MESKVIANSHRCHYFRVHLTLFICLKQLLTKVAAVKHHKRAEKEIRIKINVIRSFMSCHLNRIATMFEERTLKKAKHMLIEKALLDKRVTTDRQAKACILDFLKL